MSKFARHLASIGIFAVFGFLALGSAPSSSGSSSGNPGVGPETTTRAPELAPAPAEPDIEVSAARLWKDYHANEVAADDKYKNKTLLVSGEVSSIDKDFLGDIVLRLVTPNPYMAVMATLQSSEKSRAAQLSKGSSVSVLCTGGGMIVGSPSLRKCSVK